MNFYRKILSKYGSAFVIKREIIQSEQITLRLAGHEDYPVMVKLSQEGQPKSEALIDYIPAKYNWLLNTGNAFPCIVSVQDKPVLCSLYLLTNSTEMLGIGARTLPQFQGKGLFHFMGKNMEKFLSKEIPTIQSWLAIGEESGSRKSMLDKIGLVREIVWDTLLYNILPASPILQEAVDENIQEVSRDELKVIFSNGNQTNFNVFKTDRFAAEKPKIPYITNQENIVNAAEKNLVFVSRSEDNVVSAISFANAWTAPGGLLFEIFYYEHTVNVDTLQRHILRCLNTLLENKRNKISSNIKVLFYLNGNLNTEEIRSKLRGMQMGQEVKASSISMFKYNTSFWDSF